ncbi:MAG TPA: alpha-amylase family protein [Terracidiphilus sp.]|jgi:beta-galactosidase
MASAHAARLPFGVIGAEDGTQSTKVQPAVFPYGAVYFRKSNPPRADWARDHQMAARLGMNTFRHWFMWSVIEVAPGKYDWDGYDQMLDLAAQNKMKVIIAEMITCAPEWAFRKFPHAHFRANDGYVVESSVSASSETGGYPGLCLDNPDVRENAESFLTTLVERYRNHPGLLGYDLWNENTSFGGTPQRMYCYCDATKKKFRNWLDKKYGSLEHAGNAWHRYSYDTWDDVQPPSSFSGYPESLDWLQFRVDDAYDMFDWRVELVRRLDPHHRVTAHGVAETVENLPSQSHNEWLSAKRVDIYGFTWIASQYGDEPWRQYSAADIVRAGSRGKPFWHAEAEAGPPPISPERPGMDPKYRRNPTPDDVRLWNLVSCACGARGILYPRWRPLLDGPLFGAFGAFAMDGSVTPRAEMAGRVARWANDHAALWQSAPIKGDVGLVFVPESEMFNYMQQGTTDFYAQSIRGAYQAFFDSNIQADFVAVENLSEYKVVYLPYPVMLKEETAVLLSAYVEQGGMLISEGMPAYFGEHGHVGTVQPNYGLDKVFGATQSNVEFIPDIAENMVLTVSGAQVYGRYFRQEYELNGGQESGQFSNGKVAAVTNTFGKGRTLLMGSFPGAGYYLHHEPAARDLFAKFLRIAGIEPQLKTNNGNVQARLHKGVGGAYLWVTNPTFTDQQVEVQFHPDAGTFQTARDVWGTQKAAITNRQLATNVPARDAVVLQLG